MHYVAVFHAVKTILYNIETKQKEYRSQRIQIAMIKVTMIKAVFPAVLLVCLSLLHLQFCAWFNTERKIPSGFGISKLQIAYGT